MNDKLLPLKFPNKFSRHYDNCEECGPHGDVAEEEKNGRTYDLCEKGKTLAVGLLYPSFDEQDKLRRSSPRLEALERVAEAAKLSDKYRGKMVEEDHVAGRCGCDPVVNFSDSDCCIDRGISQALAALDRDEKPK